MLQKLTAFHGGFSLEAAQTVANASLRDLRALSGKSWLVREAEDRYQIHPLLCQYAAEKLWAEPAAGRRAREAHSRYYAGLLPRWADAMRSPRQNEAFDLMAVEFENARAAWHHLIQTGRQALAVEELLPSLFLFCGARGRGADLLSLIRAAQQAPEELSAPSQAILAVAEIAFDRAVYTVRFFIDVSSFDLPLDRLERARETLDEKGLEEVPAFWLVLATVLYGWMTGSESEVHRLGALADELGRRGDRWSQAFALQCLGRLRSQRWPFAVDPRAGDEERAALVNTRRREEVWQSLMEAAAGFDELGDQLERAHTLRLLGLYLLTYRPGEATGFLQEAFTLLRAVGDRMVAAHVLGSLGQAHIKQGKFEEGFAFIRQMRELYEQLGKREFVGYAFSMQSMEELRYGDIEQARWSREQALAIGRETNDLLDGVAWGLWELGEVERVAGNRATARRHYEESLTMFDQLGHTLGVVFYERGLGEIACAEGDFAAAHRHFKRSLDRARELGHDWSVVYGLCGLGRAAVGLGDHDAARSHFVEALKKANLVTYIDMQLIAVAGLASLALATGDAEEAIVLAKMVREHGASWRETKEQAAAVVEAARGTLPAAAVDAAMERGRRLELKRALDAFISGQSIGGSNSK